MNRLTWTLTANGHYLSGDARFEVGGAIFIGGSTYVRLLDQRTGKEYPCRTIASAKAGARSLLRVEGLTAREIEAASLAAEDTPEYVAREQSL